jgi:ABC-type oligopeptide transport system ATPase subunit
MDDVSFTVEQGRLLSLVGKGVYGKITAMLASQVL